MYYYNTSHALSTREVTLPAHSTQHTVYQPPTQLPLISSSNAAVKGQDVDDNDDGVMNPLSPSPSYPNNPQPSHTLAVNASDDIMSLSMIKFDAPYPIRQSRSISPMIQYGQVVQ